MRLTLNNIDTICLRDKNSNHPALKAALKAGYEPACIGNGVLYNKPDEWIYECYFQERVWVNILTGELCLFGQTHVGWNGWTSLWKPTHELEEGWIFLSKVAVVGCRYHRWHTADHDSKKITYYSNNAIIDAATATFVVAQEKTNHILAKYFNPDCTAVGLASGVAGGGIAAQVLGH